MNLLSIDTSAEIGSVALWQDGAILVERGPLPREQARWVLPTIDALLRRAGLDKRALDGVAFGSGPGSFTGVRLSTAIAQGLAFGLQIPAIGISTLEALAYDAAPFASGRIILCTLDARMGEVYAARYRSAEPGTQPVLIGEEVVVSPASLTEWLQTDPYLAGDGLHRHRSALPDNPAAWPEQPVARADAIAIAALAAIALRSAKPLPTPALPNYVRHNVARTEAQRRASA